jgi:hypothetical protein
MAQGGVQGWDSQSRAQEAVVRVQEREAPHRQGQGHTESEAEEKPT